MKVKMVPVNATYIREYLAEKGLKQAKLGEELGYGKSYMQTALARGVLPMAQIKALCVVTGMDYKKATTVEKHAEKVADTGGGVTIAELRELTEMIISYMQDLGKIQSDILRELKDMKIREKEHQEKMYNTLHDLDIYIRNAGAEARKSRITTNNNLSTIFNYIQKKGEQQWPK